MSFSSLLEYFIKHCPRDLYKSRGFCILDSIFNHKNMIREREREKERERERERKRKKEKERERESDREREGNKRRRNFVDFTSLFF